MLERLVDFLGESRNNGKIRYMGFSMGFLGILVGIGAAVVAGVLASGPLAGCAAVTIALSFALLPVTDVNFSKNYY